MPNNSFFKRAGFELWKLFLKKQFLGNNFRDFHEENQDSPANLMKKQFLEQFLGRFGRNNFFFKSDESELCKLFLKNNSRKQFFFQNEETASTIGGFLFPNALYQKLIAGEIIPPRRKWLISKKWRKVNVPHSSLKRFGKEEYRV